jgi:predicted SAM-dependent methyltransferase/glycosyltransferase involved in cell wall biosynthesis
VEPVYLNLGCGKALIPGFVNIDAEDGAPVQHDVRMGLPFADRSVDAIYSEHFIEHLTQAEGIALLRECRRVLRSGGVVRLATPDLDEVVRRYGTEQWLGSGMKRHGYEWVQNRCEMLNLNMREWGHRWLYNEEELRRLGRLAGLQFRGRRTIDESEHPALVGLETRPESLLILEFAKFAREVTGDPLVSILVPAYNPRYFAEALESARAQDYPNLEIVVADDDATGAIEKIALAAAESDARVRYHRNTPRQGPRQNYLRCFELAQGEFIKFLNDDDWLAPSCVRRMIGCFRQHPDVTLVTSHRQCIDEQGQDLPDVAATERPVSTDRLVDGVSLANLVIGKRCNIIGEPTTTMFRREDMADLLPDFLSFAGMPQPGIGDVGAWLNLLSMGDAIYLVDSLSKFRLHAEQWQRQPGVTDNGVRSFERLEYHGRRFGLRDPAIPLKLLTTPLGRANPRAPQNLYATAVAQVASRHFASAIAMLEKVLTLDPQYALAHNDLGVLYFRLNERPKGIEHLNLGAAADPGNPMFLMNLGGCYELMGNWGGALDAYRAVLDLRPQDQELTARVAALSNRLAEQT